MKTPLRITLICWLVAGLFAVGSATAQWEGWDYNFDREIKPWTEMQTQIPAYPGDENLISLDVGAATPHRFFVDAKSVSVSKDGIVRYTLVVKAAGGATNVSFEGIRCLTRERKYYAIGRDDKTWVRARNPHWRYIEPKQIDTQYMTLAAEYFCRGKIMVESAEEIVQALRRGPSRGNTPD